MLRINRYPMSRFPFLFSKAQMNPAKGSFLGSSAPPVTDKRYSMWNHQSLQTQWQSGAHFSCSLGPFRLDFWFLFSFWPWIRKSFFLRSFCRFSFSSSSFCFALKCSLLCRCRCSLAFFIFWLCTVLRASSSARTWQGQSPMSIVYSHTYCVPAFWGPQVSALTTKLGSTHNTNER